MRRMIYRLLRGGIVSTCCLLAVFWSLQRASNASGVTEVGDDDVVVIYNQWTGSAREVDVPGYELFVPFIERACLQKRSPQRLLFSGEGGHTPKHAPEVRFRTSDGSLVRFATLTVVSTIPPREARLALEDWNADSSVRSRLVEAYTRGIVGDEYGRFSAEEVLLRENQTDAHGRTMARLNKALALHSIKVTELSTPKLHFDSSYEKSVEDRKLAYQEVERLKAEFRQLEAERAQRLAALEKKMLIQHSKNELEIREYIANLEKDNRARRTKVSQYKLDRLVAANSRKYQLDAQTTSLAEEIRLQADVFRDQVQHMQQNGSGLIREAWIENLAKITFQVRPYSLDPQPSAVQILPALATN